MMLVTTKVITIHPQGNVNVCTEVHDNLWGSCREHRPHGCRRRRRQVDVEIFHWYLQTWVSCWLYRKTVTEMHPLSTPFCAVGRTSLRVIGQFLKQMFSCDVIRRLTFCHHALSAVFCLAQLEVLSFFHLQQILDAAVCEITRAALKWVFILKV